MDSTDRFSLPMIAPSQAQKHVTHNEAISLVDGLLHLVLETVGLSEPPASTATASCHFVGDEPVGAWGGQAGKLALLDSSGWKFVVPVQGMLAYRVDEELVCVFADGAWVDISTLVEITEVARLGIGAEADSMNRLVLKSNAALLAALGTGDGGTGDFRLYVNRDTTANKASLLFQTAFLGGAEIGLSAGSSDLEIRTSADGASWSTALSATGAGELRAAQMKTPSGATYWNADNDGGGSGLDADLLDGQEGSFYQNAGNLNAGTINIGRLPTAVRAETSTVGPNSLDWNAMGTAGWYDSLLVGNGPNGPGGTSYYHLLVLRFVSGTVTQVAFPYGATFAALGGDTPVFMRGRYNNAWTAWQRISTEARSDTRYLAATAYTATDVFTKVLSLHGSGSGLTTDKVSSYASGALPSASARGAGALILVTGLTPARLGYSDGTSWRSAWDGAVLS